MDPNNRIKQCTARQARILETLTGKLQPLDRETELLLRGPGGLRNTILFIDESVEQLEKE